jgi:hypothetical protein
MIAPIKGKITSLAPRPSSGRTQLLSTAYTINKPANAPIKLYLRRFIGVVRRQDFRVELATTSEKLLDGPRVSLEFGQFCHETAMSFLYGSGGT